MRDYRGKTKEGKWVYGDLIHVCDKIFIGLYTEESEGEWEGYGKVWDMFEQLLGYSEVILR